MQIQSQIQTGHEDGHCCQGDLQEAIEFHSRVQLLSWNQFKNYQPRIFAQSYVSVLPDSCGFIVL